MGGNVELQLEEGIARLTLDRPERLNSLDEALWNDLAGRLDEAMAARPRALVMTGAGANFSTGMDLTSDNPLIGRLRERSLDAQAARAIISGLRMPLEKLWQFPAPTIAAIEGACIGGGFVLALGCDVRVAGAGAQVSLPEVALGVVPDLGGITRLVRFVGPGRAAWLVLSGRSFSAEEGARLGFFEMVVGTGSALEEATTLARAIARNAPRAVQGALAVLRRVPDLPLEQALAVELEAGVRALSSGDPTEWLRAAAEKRRPSWSSKPS